MLKIKIAATLPQKFATRLVENEMLVAGIEHQILDFSENLALVESFAAGANAIVCPLKNLPTALPEGLVIAALSARADAADWLLVRREVVDNQQFLKIPAGGELAIVSEIQKLQFADFRADVAANLIEVANLDEVRHAAIFSAAELDWAAVDCSGFEVFKINPHEFVPAVGQGAVAWLTLADDLPTRRSLKKIHRPEVAACTNVERKILKNLGEETAVAVFCERDLAGNFHVAAARKLGDSLRRARVSQTTSVGLAERVLSQI